MKAPKSGATHTKRTHETSRGPEKAWSAASGDPADMVAGMGREELVRAAGGIIWRSQADGADGVVEVVIVHRPRYDDWSFPKGKNDPGEPDEQCALREVLEETGFAVVLGPELPTVEYIDRRGSPKSVRYWTMTIASGLNSDPNSDTDGFIANDEVDELRWVRQDQAALLLSYPADRLLLEELGPTLAEADAVS